MKLYSTTYRQGDATMASVILADNDSEAERLATLRGIGETVVGFPLDNHPRTVSMNVREIFAEISFTAWVQLKSGIGVDEVIGPLGWMTQFLLSRSNHFDPVEPTLNALIDKVNVTRALYGMLQIRRIS